MGSFVIGGDVGKHIEVIIVAVVGAISAIVAAWIAARTRAENKHDHSSVVSRLDDLRQTVMHGLDRIENRMDDHMEWHAERDRERSSSE